MKKNNVISLFDESTATTPENTCFAVRTAVNVGVEKALILCHLRYCLVMEEKYEFEGINWLRATNKDWKSIFPYLSIQKTLYLLRELEAQGYLCSKKFINHNPAIYKFYALTQKGWDA